MHTESAQLPSADHGDDRVFIAESAVVVLDGASAFIPTEITPGVYTETLGNRIIDLLSHNPQSDLRAVLATAISHAASKFSLTPGTAPSSTVSIIRQAEDNLDVLILGDSPVILGRGSRFEVLTDSRLQQLALPQSSEYRRNLLAGTGYGSEHRRILASLQQAQRERRNQPGGYWIAESDPNAASYALIKRRQISEIDWVILATDGASNLIEALDIKWPMVARLDSSGLTELLRRCHQWETEVDPCGQALPRAKRHDDKTLAVVQFDITSPA